MVAAELGNLEIVQEFIRRGANVDLDDVVRSQAHTHTHTPLTVKILKTKSSPGEEQHLWLQRFHLVMKT